MIRTGLKRGGGVKIPNSFPPLFFKLVKGQSARKCGESNASLLKAREVCFEISTEHAPFPLAGVSSCFPCQKFLYIWAPNFFHENQLEDKRPKNRRKQNCQMLQGGNPRVRNGKNFANNNKPSQ